MLFFFFFFCFFFRSKLVLALLLSSPSSFVVLILRVMKTYEFLNCNQSVFFVFLFGPNFVLQKASAFPPFGVFSREISRFFFFFCFSSLTQKRRTEMKAFRSFNALSSRRRFEFLFFSAFLFFERRSDARDSLLRGGKRTRTRSRSREPSFGAR